MTTDPTQAGRSWHDMGGLASEERAPGPEHDFALWEKRVDALMVLTSAKGLLTVDSLRRALEEMGPDAFDSMSYYERWIAAIARNLLETGVFGTEELAERMASIADRGPTYGAAQADGTAP